MTGNTLALVFPGQGSQKVGMLAEIAQAFPVIEQTFAEASEAIGYDMWDRVQNGEQELLNLTEHTQPLLLTASVALWRVWQQNNGAMPAFMAGHSLGEFSALVCADCMDFSDAVTLVRDRGRFMQSAVPVGEGSMAAILGLDDATIIEICAATGAEAVNFNSPGQVVIAGRVAAVDLAIEQLKAAGAKRAMGLPVSAPFHTSMMRPAGVKLAEKIAGLTLKSPSVPVVHNVNASTESDPEAIKNLLVQQISSPVNWVGCVQTMLDNGIEQTLECGPGKVLSGLSKRIHKPLLTFNIDSVDGLEKALAGQ
ncbi:MAG: [acyl-carrier-protein] S-malonyltransferase [Paraglaciecola psychrophila]|jgi:[acyl-carrier-protein] S-malonyltransferase